MNRVCVYRVDDRRFMGWKRDACVRVEVCVWKSRGEGG